MVENADVVIGGRWRGLAWRIIVVGLDMLTTPLHASPLFQKS